MQRLTGTELAEFALNRCGMPYFYGAKISHGILTEEFMKEMHRKFPQLVDDVYLKKAREKGQVGQVNVDCSGLIGAYRGRERSTAQLYSSAYLRLPMERVKDFAIGTVLWKVGHVGIYIGIRDGFPCCVEAKGIDYGTILSKTEDTDWKVGLTFVDIHYEYEKKVAGTWRRKNVYRVPEYPVTSRETAKKHGLKRVITSGEGVCWLQRELAESGYETKVDGIFGEETYKELIAYQTSCEIRPDGIAGEITRKKLYEK